MGIRFVFIFLRNNLEKKILGLLSIADSTLSALVATVSDYFSTQLSGDLGIFSSSMCLKIRT